MSRQEFIKHLSFQIIIQIGVMEIFFQFCYVQMCLMMIFNMDFGPIIGKVKRGYLDRTATGLGEETVRGTGTGIWNRVRYVRQGYGGQEQRDMDRTMNFSMKKKNRDMGQVRETGTETGTDRRETGKWDSDWHVGHEQERETGTDT